MAATTRTLRPWRLNQVANVIAMAVVLGILGLFVFNGIRSTLLGPTADDPYGWGQLFALLAAGVLLPPLALLVAAALAFRHRHRSGFALQAGAGAVLGVYGGLIAASMPGAVGLLLASWLVLAAAYGLLETRRG